MQNCRWVFQYARNLSMGFSAATEVSSKWVNTSHTHPKLSQFYFLPRNVNIFSNCQQLSSKKEDLKRIQVFHWLLSLEIRRSFHSLAGYLLTKSPGYLCPKAKSTFHRKHRVRRIFKYGILFCFLIFHLSMVKCSCVHFCLTETWEKSDKPQQSQDK